jgi:hypothetical protein
MTKATIWLVTALASIIFAMTVWSRPEPQWNYAVAHLYLHDTQSYPYPLQAGDTFTIYVNHPNATAEHVVASGESYVAVLLDLAAQLQDELPDFFIDPDTGTLLIQIQGRTHYRVRAVFIGAASHRRQELEVIQ